MWLRRRGCGGKLAGAKFHGIEAIKSKKGNLYKPNPESDEKERRFEVEKRNKARVGHERQAAKGKVGEWKQIQKGKETRAKRTGRVRHNVTSV